MGGPGKVPAGQGSSNRRQILASNFQKNIDEAFKWYAKAAEKGYSWAKRKLARRAEIEEDLRQKKLRKER